MAHGARKTTLTSAPVRLVLALAGLVFLPLAYPATAWLRPLLVGYVALAGGALLLARRGFGGMAGAFSLGLVDLAILTFVVHRTDSAGGALLAVYLLACTLNAVAVGKAVGLALAAAATLLYGAVIAGEQLGFLPYAPDAPSWIRATAPPLSAALAGWLLVSSLTLLSAAVAGRLVAHIRRDELALAEANARLEQLSQRDPLTELYNRRHLMTELEVALARVRRGGALAVVMLDLDGFKRVNDSRGHLHGDSLLQEIANELASSTRDSDVLGRYGGDEFLVLMPDTASEQARVAASRLATAVRRVGERFDAARPITASVGIALAHPDDGVRPLVQRADRAAYRAKVAGGDRVQVAPEDGSAANEG